MPLPTLPLSPENDLGALIQQIMGGLGTTPAAPAPYPLTQPPPLPVQPDKPAVPGPMRPPNPLNPGGLGGRDPRPVTAQRPFSDLPGFLGHIPGPWGWGFRMLDRAIQGGRGGQGGNPSVGGGVGSQRARDASRAPGGPIGGPRP